MDPIPERGKLRRASLWKIGKIYAKAARRVMLAVVLAVGLTIAGLCVLYWMGIDIGNRRADQPVLPIILFFLVTFIGGSWLNSRCLAMVEKAQEEAANLYVPPVTAGALPAEEVLLRGSAPPVPPESESLLRSAHSSRANEADELLRPDEVPV